MLLNFQSQFADDVESGRKTITIRAERKDGQVAKIGDTMHLWTGCRTKLARPLGKGICKSVEEISIVLGDVMVNGISLDYKQLAELARADGFDNVESFFGFHLFKCEEKSGWLYSWDKVEL